LEFGLRGLSKFELLKLDFLKFEITKHGGPKVGISRHQKYDGLSLVKHCHGPAKHVGSHVIHVFKCPCVTYLHLLPPHPMG
jgi:hypothetical protein